MAYIVLGAIAFFFFILYDINSVLINHRLLHSSFFLGCILLIGATSGIIYQSWAYGIVNFERSLFFFVIAVGFFILLLYTLFFALPFEDTYVESDQAPKTCQTGVYALCRHPGVLWFIGFYFFLWLAFPSNLLFAGALIFSGLNILYIIVQDYWTFVKIFPDYLDYKKNTPFLVPNLGSMTRCRKTLGSKEMKK